MLIDPSCRRWSQVCAKSGTKTGCYVEFLAWTWRFCPRRHSQRLSSGSAARARGEDKRHQSSRPRTPLSRQALQDLRCIQDKTECFEELKSLMRGMVILIIFYTLSHNGTNSSPTWRHPSRITVMCGFSRFAASVKMKSSRGTMVASHANRTLQHSSASVEQLAASAFTFYNSLSMHFS